MHLLFKKITFYETIGMYTIAEELSLASCAQLHGYCNSHIISREMLIKEMKDGSLIELTERVRKNLIQLLANIIFIHLKGMDRILLTSHLKEKVRWTPNCSNSIGPLL